MEILLVSAGAGFLRDFAVLNGTKCFAGGKQRDKPRLRAVTCGQKINHCGHGRDWTEIHRERAGAGLKKQSRAGL